MDEHFIIEGWIFNNEKDVCSIQIGKGWSFIQIHSNIKMSTKYKSVHGY
jgi:hypothetical protein